MISAACPADTTIPQPDARLGLRALGAMGRQRSILAALSVFHAELGDIFGLRAGAFEPAMLAGPAACRFVLVQEKAALGWRVEGDPVTRLLRQGLLVQDDAAHDSLRRQIQPALHRRMVERLPELAARLTDAMMAAWSDGQVVEIVAEMRRLTLLILMEALFQVDFAPYLEKLTPAIVRAIAYISPGAWAVWPWLPRPGYRRALATLDEGLLAIIRQRRAAPTGGDDLLSRLVADPALDDDLIRDQMLTLLIAGHDTSTASLSWALHLLSQHPEALARAAADVQTALGDEPPTMANIARLGYLEQVIRETLRLYPPIHIGNRLARRELRFAGRVIPAGRRVAYSIYLTHRHPAHWPRPDEFDPDRFAPEQPAPAPYTYLPFGGGARNCVGMAFAQVEVKVILARILQQFQFTPLPGRVWPHMGATLEPRPGVRLRLQRRSAL
jgi:cytochrome P450